MSQIKYSVIVPIFNEEGNVVKLHSRIIAVCEKFDGSFEVIFVDDGSTDNTVARCESLRPLKLIRLRKNFGQTAAFDAGIKESSGEIIITLDGDMQNDPADFSLLIAELERGKYDVVSGWRYNRKDTLGKRLSSRGANLLRKFLFRDSIHDSGCALKAYRRKCFNDLDLFGEMHRFIPALLEMQGFKIGEVKVSHHSRLHGNTKYNWRRYLKSFVDMLSIWFWSRYAARPLHLLGSGGVIFCLIGAVILGVMAIERIFFGIELSNRIWPLAGIFLVLAGIQLFAVGIITDLVVKTYFRGRNRMNYSIEEIKIKN